MTDTKRPGVVVGGVIVDVHLRIGELTVGTDQLSRLGPWFAQFAVPGVFHATTYGEDLDAALCTLSEQLALSLHDAVTDIQLWRQRRSDLEKIARALVASCGDAGFPWHR